MEQKRKDLMSSAMSEFWASDYKIGQPKINVPKIKTKEDDAFDAFWGRGNYTPQPRMPNMNASTGSRYVANVRPVQYQQQIRPMSAANRAEIMKQELILQQIRARQGLRSSQNTGQVIGGVVRAGRFGAKAGTYAVREGIPMAQNAIKTATPIAKAGIQKTAGVITSVLNKFKKKPVQPSVGLGGAIYEANKAAGKKSIYD